jgi:hypothetical protein
VEGTNTVIGRLVFASRTRRHRPVVALETFETIFRFGRPPKLEARVCAYLYADS